MRPHLIRRVPALVAIATLGVSATAQSLQWQSLPALARPASRTGFALVPFGDELLLFGGDAANATATEHVWNGISWRSLTTPVPRRNGAAVAAAADGELIVYGGIDGAGAQLSDTWHYQNGVWVQESPGAVPTLSNPSVAYDPIGGNFVLVGQPPVGAMQTFRFVGGNWQTVSGLPLPIGIARLATDSVRGEVLATVEKFPASELFRLVGSDWQSQVGLVYSTGFLPTFDAERGRAVLVTAPSLSTLRTREWDGDALQPEVATSMSGATQLRAVCHHAARHESIAAFALGNFVELRRYTPAPVPMATTYGDACIDPTLRFDLAAGDSPQPGLPHRLEADGIASSPILVVSVIGLSHTAASGAPLPVTIPIGTLGCQLRVEPLVMTFLGTSLPVTQLMQFSNAASLLGLRYDAQIVLLNSNGVTDTSNGVELQLGRPLDEQHLVEDFASSGNRDALASGDPWGNGGTSSAGLGGDGRHGSFVASDGLSIGGGAYIWNTDNQLIPGSRTLDGQDALVNDGRFYFSDFVVPAGVTVRFVGTVPAVVAVRGQVRIDGRVECNGQDLPFQISTVGPSLGQRVSTMHARGVPVTTQVLGQPGTAGGCGAGRGGNGGKEGNNQGPEIVSGVMLNDGQPGEDVRLLAGHAYAAQAVGTAGRGGKQTPATGISPNLPGSQLILNVYSPFYSSGGSGGGNRTVGGAPVECDPTSATPIITEPPVAGGAAFPLLPYPNPAPPGYSSLQHFAVGGSGGGGGGSHGFGLFGFSSSTERWMAGHGGSGGGGAIVLRAGGDVAIGAGAELEARGGLGVFITGDDLGTVTTADINAGISSPGGGGSGGSWLIQSAANIHVAGEIDTSGGTGSVVALVSLVQMTIQTPGHGGNGSSGDFRLEAAGTIGFAGTSVPVFSPSINTGALNDRDARSGSRSKWTLLPSTSLPVYVRYEMFIDVDGDGSSDAVFSDDPSVGVLADGVTGPVQLRLQGARLDPITGQPLAGGIGPWRTTARPSQSSINRDHARLVRFDLVTNRELFPNAQVRQLRIIWR